MSINPLRSIPEHFFETATRFPTKPAFLTYTTNTFTPITYAQAADQVRRIVTFLQQMGIKIGDRVAILSENRYEWALLDIAALALGAITVPIYSTLSSEQVKGILADSGASCVMVSNLKHLRTVEEAKVRTLKYIVTLFPHKQYHTLQEALESKPVETLASVPGSALCSIVYTSGTTGKPKGVQLSHTNFLSNIDAVLSLIPVSQEDTCLSFLPLSHALERMGGYYLMLCVGATIAYARSAEMLSDDMLLVRPTVMIAVPRLYEKIHAKMQKTLDEGPALRRRLFAWAIGVGERMRSLAQAPLMLRLQYLLANALVYKKIRSRFGGRLRFFVSGGAPLKAQLGELFLSAGIPILEGYGLTETAPVLTVNKLGALRFGTVGKPLPNVLIVIAHDGEILAKGPNISSGYWKRPKENTKSFDKQGYFHTGDIGQFDPEGNLVITDRKKDLIVLSNGKKVAPQPIEQVITKSKYISQAFLFGDKRSYLVALIVPDWSVMQPILAQWGLADTPPAQLIHKELVREFLLGEISKQTQHYARFEQVKRIAVLADEFTQIKGELTPTLKMKRPIICKNYAMRLEELYHD